MLKELLESVENQIDNPRRIYYQSGSYLTVTNKSWYYYYNN